jgi:ABC-type transporter Mla subunit MlaD
MKDNRINALIAGVALVAAVLMTLALSFAIGKWSFGTATQTFTIKFPNATGISANSEVKFAGAHAGRVKEVHLIPRKDEDEDPHTGLFNCVDVVIEVDKDLELGSDVTATIKQDGFGISAKYVLLTPGPDHNSPALADNSVLQGEMPFDLSDLIQPAGEALTQAKQLIGQLGPVMKQLGPMMNRLDELSVRLGPVLTHGDKFIQDGDSVLSNFNTPDSRERLQDMIANLSVATANLKVVSYNAKALTATLASKPWRVFWGGPVVQPPPESADLNSNKVIRLHPDVEVNAAAPTPSTGAVPSQH